MSEPAVPPLVTTEWLAARLDRSDIKPLDGSWYMPAEKRDPQGEFIAGHIPGAAFFDIDRIADTASGLPHMLPKPAEFAAAVGALGIGSDDTVIVYDGAGIFSAPRVWWTFRVFGHDKVAVLDGGLPKWRRENRAIETGLARVSHAQFTRRLRPELVRDFAAVTANLTNRRELVLDARSAGRFAGTDPEPRPGLRGGHIPGSRNLPFQALVDPATGTMRPPAELARLFTAAGVDAAKPVTASCGSGLTAAILAFGLYLTGHETAAVYDGSWSEWGGRPEAPIET